MAENTIDNLSIQVVASAERAISTFNRLASGASGLKNAANGAAGGMQDMAQGARDAGTATQQAGTQSGKARPNIKGVGKDAKDAGDNAKKGSSGLATFWQSLKRIAYYRMIRSIIKSIGQAFKEGAQNLYQWSSANPGLSDFAKNMNRISTSVTYLKNSLGAMLEPIVRILTPVIEWVIDKLVGLIEKVNQFFAALSGAETYTAAKKVATTWGDAADDVASSTHKAAEDIKRTILGFDEINKLDKPNSGSYDGGSGLPSASAAAQDMFEERPLEGWAKTISDFIRTIASWIDGIFGPVKQLFTDTGDAFDDLNRSLDAAQQEDKTVNINVKINTTAEKLWNDFVDEWNAIKNKILFFKISPTPPVDLLWNKIKNAWDSVDHTLGFLIETASSANGHWKYFKNDWDKEDRTVGFVIKTASSANGHWDVFKKAWDKENRTVGFLIKTASSAKGHWDNFKKEWDNLGSNTVGFLIKTASSANGHWDVFKKEWDSGDRKVGFIITTASTANGHWGVFKKAWADGDRKVGFIITTASTANGHWNTFKKEWDADDRKVGFIITTASSATGHWNVFKKEWDKENRAVGFIIKTASSANGHWNTFNKAWVAKDRKVGFIITTASSADGHWGVFKKAWVDGNRKVGFIITTSSTADGHWGVFKKAWVDGDRKVGFIITTASSAEGHWGVFKKAWVDGDRKVGFIIKTASTADGHWGVFKKAWDAGDRTVYVDVQLKKKAWTTVTDFVDDSFGGATGGGGKTKGGGAGRSIGVGVKLQENTADKGSKSLWDMWWGIFNKTLEIEQDIIIKAVGGKGIKSVGNDKNALNDFSPSTVTVNSKPGNGFTGKLSGTNTYTLKGIEDTSVKVGAAPNWASTIGGLVPYLQIDNLSTTIKALAKKGWGTKTFKGAVGASDTTTSITANLSKKWGTQSPVSYLGLSGLSTTIKVGLKADDSKIKMRVEQGTATLISATKRTENVEMQTALGGVFSNGRWSRIPQYANGTTNAHGSLFLAGEAGPEIVGHVGGRTEVLNKSQLASAMYSAVQAAMAPAAANFASAAQSMGVANVSFDFETLAEMIRQGVEQAMGRQNELDRQRNEYLRQINEKDYNPEISTSSINRAQQRMNRRAGTTIVSVGT